MSGPVDYQLDHGQLDGASAKAYREAVHLGYFSQRELRARGFTPQDAARAECVLRRLRLLQPMPGAPHVMVPVNPEAASADLLAPLDEEILRLQRETAEVRSQILSLVPTYFAARRRRNEVEAFDIVSDVDTVQSMLEHHRSQCRSEVLTVHPGGPQQAQLPGRVRRSMLATLDRGVRLRTIYQHTARGDLSTVAYLREAAARGAEVRTTEELIDRMVIYDREIAFLPERASASGERGTLIIKEPNLVTFLCSVFNHMWTRAVPFTQHNSAPAPLTEDVKRSILRLMANGYKDEMVARRLGMSVRTCRRHISEITEELRASSRFQAGVVAAQRGLIDWPPGLAQADLDDKATVPTEVTDSAESPA